MWTRGRTRSRTGPLGLASFFHSPVLGLASGTDDNQASSASGHTGPAAASKTTLRSLAPRWAHARPPGAPRRDRARPARPRGHRRPGRDPTFPNPLATAHATANVPASATGEPDHPRGLPDPGFGIVAAAPRASPLPLWRLTRSKTMALAPTATHSGDGRTKGENRSSVVGDAGPAARTHNPRPNATNSARREARGGGDWF
jgi:hypothetical protein